MADYLSFLANEQKLKQSYPGVDVISSGYKPGQSSVKVHYGGQAYDVSPDDLMKGPSAWGASNKVFDLPTLTPDIPATSESSSTSSGTTSGTTSSGIDWGSPGVSGLLDQIKDWTGRASGMAENVIPNINNFYGNMMRNALGPQAFQGTLNTLRERNMLDSSVAENALANTATGIAGNIGGQGLNTYLKGYDTQMQMPGMLTELANMLGGRGTTSTGATSGTASGTTLGTASNTGSTTNPRDIYDLVFRNFV